MYTTHIGFLHRKTCGPVFFPITLKEHIICSFVILQVKYNPRERNRVKRQTGRADTQTNSDFIAAQLQAAIKFTKVTVRHTYLHALHSTCNAMNNMLRLTQAAIMEHPTIAARQLFNVSTIHARSSEQILQI